MIKKVNNEAFPPEAHLPDTRGMEVEVTTPPPSQRKTGCITAVIALFLIIGLSTFVISFFSGDPTGAGGNTSIIYGAIVGFIIWILILLPKKTKKRICDICGSPITYTGYTGKINGKHYQNICADCRKEAAKQIRKAAFK